MKRQFWDLYNCRNPLPVSIVTPLPISTVPSISLLQGDEASEREDFFLASEFLNPFWNVEGLVRGSPTFPVKFGHPDKQ